NNPGTFHAYAFTNHIAANSNLVQVVFVSDGGATNMDIDVRFNLNYFPSDKRNANKGAQAIVQFAVPDTDVVTGDAFTNLVYFSDNSVLTETNFFLQQNLSSLTARPNPYDITLQTPQEWSSALFSNTTYSPLLLYNPSYVNSQVTNLYAAYSANIGEPGTSG